MAAARQLDQPGQALERDRPRDHLGEHAGLDHQAQRGRGSSASSSRTISAWIRSPERRRSSRGHAAGGERRGISGRPPVVGEEAEQAQDAQIVLGDARRRVADEAHPAGREVRAPAEVVVEPAAVVAAHGVDREVAARRVEGEIVGELDSAWRPSQATSRRSVVISKRRSSASVVTVPCARPVGIAGRPARSSRRITRSGARASRRRARGRQPQAEQTIAHAAADEARRMPVGAERGQHSAAGGRTQPGLRGERAVAPGGHGLSGPPCAPARSGHPPDAEARRSRPAASPSARSTSPG